MRKPIGLMLLTTGIILGGYAASTIVDQGEVSLASAIIACLSIAMLLVGARYVFLKGE